MESKLNRNVLPVNITTKQYNELAEISAQVAKENLFGMSPNIHELTRMLLDTAIKEYREALPSRMAANRTANDVLKWSERLMNEKNSR